MTYLERKTNRLFILCITVISILFSGGCIINDHRLDENAPTVAELRLTPTPTPDAFRTKPFEMRIDVNKIYIAKSFYFLFTTYYLGPFPKKKLMPEKTKSQGV